MYAFIEFVLEELKNSFALVFLACIGAVAVLAAAYIFHKRKYKGVKPFPWAKALLWLMFAGYLAIVAYATLFRMSRGRMEYNLHLFRAWREAWNNYSAKNLANVLLNVAMFVPMGFLLPLLFNNCRKWYVAISAGFGFSLVIELIQLVSRRGVCDVDDLFANTLGAVIGFLLVMTILSGFVIKKWKTSLLYGCLSLASVLGICSIFLLYNTQEYGNLPNAAVYTVDTSSAGWSLACELPSVPEEVAVYRTQTRTMQDCDVFADEFKEIIHTEYMTITYYQEAAYYMDHGSEGGAHFLYVNYLDQGYEYSVHYQDEAVWMDADRASVEAALEQYPLYIPEYAEFTAEGDGWHSFTVNQYLDGANLIDGTLRVRYAEDGSVREIRNRLLKYTYYDKVAVITPEQAYQNLCAGKFNDGGFFEHKDPADVKVTCCLPAYAIDTKGFYQPVYYFDVASEDGSYTDRIMIPAMK